MKNRYLLLGVGELLWDFLPEGPRLGGAPANFAVMSARLRNHAVILSRMGYDDLGGQAMEKLHATPADTGFLQFDRKHSTGHTSVSFSSGQPQYTIHEQAAWDYLELSDDWIRLVEQADAICFGTLAQRNAVSRQTIQTLLARTSSTCLRVLDVNLRAPFYSAGVIRESLALATVLKMSEEEVLLVLSLLGLGAKETLAQSGLQADKRRLLTAAHALLEEFSGLALVVITRGSQGSLLVAREEWNEHPGFQVTVADAVGAGDAFTAGIVHYLLGGADLATLNEAGNRWGAWMASQSGAMPELPEALLDATAAQIERKVE